MTKLLTIEQLNIGADILKNGGLVAFPTETVYGLGANALDENAVKKIFEAKGRPADNPLIVHISDYEILNELVTEIPEKAKLLMEKFWPGPLTIILNKTDKVPDIVSGGLNTVAVRMPKNPVALELIKTSKVPVAAPSANTSGKPSPTKAQYVVDDMYGKIDAIIDGGNCEVGLESTVLDMSGTTPKLLRPGGVTFEQLTEVLGEISKKFECNDNEKPASPGMKYKHYSPDAKVVVVKNDFENYINKCCEKYENVAVICYGDIKINKKCKLKKVVNSSLEYANVLFSAMRDFDKQHPDIILAQDVDDTGINLAIKNRLYRCCGYNFYEKSN
ncbi:MAG: threonylcarbamoyl-AMP synthase [Clostridia bacterium]|nr:threonylcarbamoyl-AMP synthase [Clostridia bacterium]